MKAQLNRRCGLIGGRLSRAAEKFGMNEQNGALGDAPSDSSKRLAEVKEMPTLAIRLRPKSSVGAWLSSDTLFGSICWAIRLTEDEQVLRQWLDRCQSDPSKWVLSSAFPFFDTDKSLHFLPKPLTLNLDVEMVALVAGNDRKKLLVTMGQAKAKSKCAYISETLFASAAKGELKERDLLEKVLSGEIEIRGGFILTKSEANLLPKRLWSTTDIQHTVIDRVLTSGAEGLLYFDTEHFFGNRVGLFFLLRCPEDFPIDSVVRFGEHDGLGGNRSVGKGHFELRKQPADDWLAQLQPGEGNAVVLLPTAPQEAASLTLTILFIG